MASLRPFHRFLVARVMKINFIREKSSSSDGSVKQQAINTPRSQLSSTHLSGTHVTGTQPKKERKWWEPFPEYHFNWYKMRFEEMSAKEKDKQFWVDAFMVTLVCGIILSIATYIENHGWYWRDKFYELVSGEKVDELGKANYRKHEPWK